VAGGEKQRRDRGEEGGRRSDLYNIFFAARLFDNYLFHIEIPFQFV